MSKVGLEAMYPLYDDELIGIINNKTLLKLETFVDLSGRPLINVYTMPIESDTLFGWLFCIKSSQHGKQTLYL